MKVTPYKSFLGTYQERRSKDSHRFLTGKRIVCIDFLLLNAAFFISHFFKQNTIRLDDAYTKLLLLFYLSWWVSGMIGKKFRISSFLAFGPGMWTCLLSSLYLLYLVSFMVVVLGVTGFSRLHIFGTCLLLSGLEVTLWGVMNAVFNRRATDRISFENILSPFRIEKNISYGLMVIDFCLAVFAFFIVNYLKRGDLTMLPDYPRLFLIFLGLWFFTSFVTGKFAVRRYQNEYFFLWQWFKAGFVMMAFMAVLIFGARLFYYSRLQALGPILVLMGFEFFLVHFYYRSFIAGNNRNPADVESVDKVREILKQDSIPAASNLDIIRERLMSPAREKIKNRLSDFPDEEFEFIDAHIDLDDMMQVETAVERTSDLFNLDADRVMLRLYLNMKRINDIRRLNVYFLQVHQMLLPGGYLAGFAHTIKTRYAWVYEKYPKYIAHLVYGADFCIHRVLPKLPGLQKVYFQLTRGR
ncbi:MAG: sugar transferase, partial [Desulfotignum sp.]|nr:sugar transferase [Desulfotignum sp.]